MGGRTGAIPKKMCTLLVQHTGEIWGREKCRMRDVAAVPMSDVLLGVRKKNPDFSNDFSRNI